jgi:Flp pilus assembly CpaE family ATPase
LTPKGSDLPVSFSKRPRRPPKDIYEFMEEQGLHILKTVISERVAFVYATNRGLTVFETKDDPRAGWEIGSLFQEIIDGKAQT